jgi:hypothetical protein
MRGDVPYIHARRDSNKHVMQLHMSSKQMSPVSEADQREAAGW